ncbi:hypothetical protein COS93_02550 [bacterium (Candidatus Gribaldobacteria) CG07_land_8_20_14_0_80_33_18]|uniref:Insulinase family protein n=1 Tax=bacterium (Candidatus Gribaldobacteria) CG07_land_8_20_14_0_80_33_18 TaxID=2014272 RepID=A0A2M6Z1Z6_9BACT|nr:MAG: hypothetical protein COU04_01520 [bacterium (Candidatus Gribaldobacteria) CG10_big_fil_rev_8_21_14_0_10_33_41]PIU46434.1 MAG: hypothetical protein COS93_02550 [bacterium (Candidatus Gribaldobacteria) CG07_land_8_20_14_0_80_33_18]PJA00910.1 MAG: hypothetical protein COX75_01370 [bacterium (Candidatus Gribaldobacteria) CG_4_10_14_0_2_um_filter_33_15]PJB08248.1 MAG: hypothetical protein CO122_02300 [bacterium (Candidatus Gribaldobacteria) CG_4_9_14_3_um_filter_33_9]
MFFKTIFKNGLRIITVPMKNTETVTFLVLVATGSKYETKEKNGISHFLEHLFFKGTKKRPTTLKIAETLDKVGGSYNAFTSNEFTGYFAKVSSQYLDLALDWISDIFLNSKLKEADIEKEKGVIIEEINMYQDTPVSYIKDLYEKLLYGDQPAGWLTIGEKEIITKFKRKNLIEYLKTHYSALNTVIIISGNINKGIEEKIKKYFKNIEISPPSQKIKVEEIQNKPQTLIHFKETDQTHLCLGVRGYDLFNPKRYAQEILSVILGGNMSSRLFISIRAKKGLCYYIQTSSDSSTDTGYIVTQAGVPHKNLPEVINLILAEYKNLRKGKISLSELQKAKDYLKGSLSLSLEPSDAQAFYYGLQELLTGKILTPKEKFAKIDEITPSDILEIARDIFKPEKLNLTIIGPHKHEPRIYI